MKLLKTTVSHAACALGALAIVTLAPARAAAEEAVTIAVTEDAATTAALPTTKAVEIKGDPPGKLTFYAHSQAKHEAHGEFKKWQFTEINIPNDSYEGASLQLVVDIGSLREENEKRQNHLMQPDFFDVKVFPTAVVTIDNVQPVEGKADEYTADATVEIRKTKTKFPAKFKLLSKEPLTVEGEVVLSRKKIDVGKPFDEADARAIFDEVKVNFKTELKK